MADRKQKKQSGQSSEVRIIEAIFVGIGQVFKLILRAVRGGSSTVDPEATRILRNGWVQVELHLTTPATLALAISEADKLFDVALRAAGVPGNTLGERLKAAESHFDPSQYNQLWNAHKLRNRLAHEVGVSIDKQETETAVRSLQRGITRLGFSI